MWLQTFSGHLHKTLQRGPIGAPPGVPALRPADDNAGTGHWLTRNPSWSTAFRCFEFEHGNFGRPRFGFGPKWEMNGVGAGKGTFSDLTLDVPFRCDRTRSKASRPFMRRCATHGLRFINKNSAANAIRTSAVTL